MEEIKRMTHTDELTDQEEIYAQERAAGKNKTRSAQKAYPDAKPSSCRQMGYECEKRPKVLERIRELKEERAENSGLDVHEQIRRYTELYFMALDSGRIESAAKMLERIDAIGGFNAPSTSVSLKGSIEAGDALKGSNLKADLEKFANVLKKHSSEETPKEKPKSVH
jgi:phage terminase small subunit